VIKRNFRIYRKNPSVLCTELEEGAVLLDLETKYYYTLNSTGLVIWQLLEKLESPFEIARKLTVEYEVDEERATASVQRLLEELEQEKLILALESARKVVFCYPPALPGDPESSGNDGFPPLRE
jgi:hypothetical protein